MKKLILSLIVCCIVIGCGKEENGNEKPDGISKEMYLYAIETIEIMDSYSLGKYDLDKTMDELYEIDIDTDCLGNDEYMSSLTKDEEGEFIDENSEYPKDISIIMNIADIRLQMSTLELDVKEDIKNTAIETAINIKDDLAKKINYKD